MKIYDYQGKKNISGNRVREARDKIGLSQTQLAIDLQLQGVKLERNSVSRIELETRFVSDYELRALARILKVSVDWLLENEPEEPN